jgi:hypothetical protein
MDSPVVLGSVAGLLGYLLFAVGLPRLRYQRMNQTLKKFEAYTTSPEAYGRMTLEDAFAIQLPLAEVEFPSTFSISIFFALFKTYGIPSISKLLVATGELSDKTTASKRAADTGVLITEIVLNKPGTERNLSAIARMNWLHDRYRKAGKIKDEDMLYTLSLFALEPMRWTKALEWRDLTDLERCAMAVYWKNLGEIMGIPYDQLPSASKGWVSGLEWLHELEAWSQDYEVENMVPSATNRTLGMATVDIGLTNVPKLFKPLGLQFATALLSPRLRKAMLFKDPPVWVQTTLDTAVAIRKFLLRHLFLPRPHFMRKVWFSEANPQTGKYHFEQYIGHPWYIEPSFGRRWNLKSWLLWATGGYVPSTSKTQYRPEGYLIPDLGPVKLEGQGMDEMEAAKPAIRSIQGCPFYRD